MSDKPKIYAFSNGGYPGFFQALAISEDGYVVGQHVCSHESWIPHDLGVTSEWHHEGYQKHYPDGFEVVFVPYDDVVSHKGLQEAILKLESRMKDKEAESE